MTKSVNSSSGAPRATTVCSGASFEHAAANSAFYADLEAELAAARQPYLTLVYERLFTSAEQARLLEFLELPISEFDLKPASVKQTPPDLRALISNFDQLADELAGSEYHSELWERGM